MSTSNSTKLLKYCLFQGVFIACLYYGYFKGIEGAENVALFLAWFLNVISWFMLSEDGIEIVRKNPPLIPKTIDVPLDMAIVGVFVWSGALITGVFYALHILIILFALDKAKEPKEKTPPDTKER